MFLPNNEHKFSVKVKGEATKKTFEGDFTTKCILNIQEQIEVGLRTDRYNRGSSSLNPGCALLNRTIAELEIRIARNKEGKQLAPSWWIDSDGGRLLADQNIIYDIFTEAVNGEIIWKKRVQEEVDESEEEKKSSEKLAAKKESKTDD